MESICWSKYKANMTTENWSFEAYFLGMLSFQASVPPKERNYIIWQRCNSGAVESTKCFFPHIKKIDWRGRDDSSAQKKQLQVSSHLGRNWAHQSIGDLPPYFFRVYLNPWRVMTPLEGLGMHSTWLSPDFWTNKNDIWTVRSGKSLILISKKAFQTKLTAANFRDWS